MGLAEWTLWCGSTTIDRTVLARQDLRGAPSPLLLKKLIAKKEVSENEALILFYFRKDRTRKLFSTSVSPSARSRQQGEIYKKTSHCG